MPRPRHQNVASRAQEDRVLGDGRVHPGSGNQWWAKGDKSVGEWLVECKRTDKKQITIKNTDLVKITREADVEGKRPMFCIEIGGRDYVLVLEDDFCELVEGPWDE